MIFKNLNNVIDLIELNIQKSVFRALKLGEYGLKYREEYRLYTRKPICSSQTISFITISITECYFALAIMGYGILLTIIIFVLELLWHRK